MTSTVNQPVVDVVLDHGETDAVDGDRRPVDGVARDERTAQGEAGRLLAQVDAVDLTEFFDDAGEHQRDSSRMVVMRTSCPMIRVSVGSRRSASAMVVMPRSLTDWRPRPRSTGAM